MSTSLNVGVTAILTLFIKLPARFWVKQFGLIKIVTFHNIILLLYCHFVSKTFFHKVSSSIICPPHPANPKYTTKIQNPTTDSLMTTMFRTLSLIIRSVSPLVWMMGSLWRRALHSGWRSSSGPHPRTEASWLVERWAKSTLVLGERWIVMVGWRGIDWTPMLRRRARWRMVHIWWHLCHDVARWWGDRRRN